MDLNDITWPAEVYETFEAIRLEVEDLFYEDAIKYVENRAQNVKTFYADVVQDFLPPSCIGISKEEFEEFCNYTTQDSTLSVCNNASDRPLMPPQSEECSRTSRRGGGSRRSIGIRDIPLLPKVDEPLMPERDDSEEFPVHKVESVGEVATTSYEDNFDIEVIEAESILEPSGKSRLEESCVLVEGGELDNVSQEWKKHKSSYKKKICSVLSLKMRSPVKRDISISGHEDSSDKNNDCGRGKPAAPNSCDFGWELL